MTELDELVHRRNQAPAIGTLAYILFGLILWALQLTIVYGAHTLICNTGVADSLVRPMVLVVSAIIALALLAFLVAQGPAARMLGLPDDAPGRRTYDRMSRLIGYLSMVAIFWTGSTTLFVAACVEGR